MSPAASSGQHSKLFTALCAIQGTYYLITGLWPLVSIRTFKLVTGEQGKTDNAESGLEIDHWLVMTVGALVTAVAVTLLTGAIRRTQVLELAILAMVSAIGLTAIDIIYTTRKIISPIYLLDAALEVPLIIAWCATLLRLPTSARGKDPMLVKPQTMDAHRT